MDLPQELDADLRGPRGVSSWATWLSFGTVLVNAASRFLEINPEELRVGVRPVARPGNRVHGEVYLHDTLPGGAGYARDIAANLEDIIQEALLLSRNCSDPACTGACYSCLLDYKNQMDHPYLDRSLGGALLDFILTGRRPELSEGDKQAAVRGLDDFLSAMWTPLGPKIVNGVYFPAVYRRPEGDNVAVWPIHPLQARPNHEVIMSLLVDGTKPCVHTTFDLLRRPFWVVNHLDE